MPCSRAPGSTASDASSLVPSEWRTQLGDADRAAVAFGDDELLPVQTGRIEPGPPHHRGDDRLIIWPCPPHYHLHLTIIAPAARSLRLASHQLASSGNPVCAGPLTQPHADHTSSQVLPTSLNRDR